MWRKGVSFLLLLLLSYVLSAETTPDTDLLLDVIQEEVALIRKESNLLKIQLTSSETESKMLKTQLLTLDGKLRKVSLLLAKSEADLVQSVEEVEKLKSELQTLKNLVQELSGRSRQLERANNILIGATVTCALAAIGAGVYAGVVR